MNDPRQGPHRSVRSTDAVRAAIATVTAWIQDDRELGLALAAESIDRDAIGYLDAIGGLWVIVADVAEELDVDVGSILRDIAVGVARADTDDQG